MDITKAIAISARGMDVQTARLRVIAENIANQDSTGSTPGADPYRRKTITFENKLDQELGVETVGVRNVAPDRSDLPQALRSVPPGRRRPGLCAHAQRQSVRRDHGHA